MYQTVAKPAGDDKERQNSPGLANFRDEVGVYLGSSTDRNAIRHKPILLGDIK